MMDVKGAQALADRLREPRVRVLANRVTFMVQEEQESGRMDVVAMGAVDRGGHVDVWAPSGWTRPQEEVRESFTEALETLDLAHWQATGPEDHELYASRELMAMLRPALEGLPDGWLPWP